MKEIREDKLKGSYRVSVVFSKAYALGCLNFSPGPHFNLTLQALLTVLFYCGQCRQ